MRTRRFIETALILGMLALLAAARVYAQSSSQVEAARAQIESIRPDSAYAILSAMVPPRGTAVEPRFWTLLGITELLRGHEDEAVRAFRRALDTDAALRVDSLAYLQSDVLRVFAAARNDLRRSLGPASAVAVGVPSDTVMAPWQGRLLIELRPRLRSRVVVTIAPERDRQGFVFVDTLDVGAVATTSWDLQSNGDIVPAGRYVLRVSGTDVLRRPVPLVERMVTISRMPVDTITPPFDTDGTGGDAGARAVRAPGGTGRLLLGAALGVGAASLTAMAGNHSINSGFSDRSRYVVAGAISGAAIIGFLSGRKAQPAYAAAASVDPERADAARRMVDENARRRSMAPVRIQIRGS